jgi:hypothetical protein
MEVHGQWMVYEYTVDNGKLVQKLCRATLITGHFVRGWRHADNVIATEKRRRKVVRGTTWVGD